MNTRQKHLLALLGACLVTGSLLTACTGDTQNPADTTPDSTGGTVAESTAVESQETTYSITVQDFAGTAVQDVVATIQKDGEDVKTLVVREGKATVSLPTDDYTVTLSSPKGSFYYDAEACTLTPASPSITVTLYNKADQTLPLVPPTAQREIDAEGNATYPTQNAPLVSEGATYCETVGGGEMTYFVFVPTRGGVYEVSFIADGAADLGYYGMPINVFETKLLDTVDNKVEIQIRDDSVNLDNPNQTGQFVFGILPENTATTHFIVTITRKGDVPVNPVDLPWEEYKATQVKAFEGQHGNTLTDLDVTDPDLTVVFNENDGYYHYGTADGPVVFIRIDSASPYLDSLVTITEHTRLGVYIYDDDGNLLRKESYHEMLDAYKAICDENGVCPLTPELEYMVKMFGEKNEWWNFADDRDIFGDKIVPADTAWLFICCYYK